MTSAALISVLGLLLAQSAPTINVGLRDGTVMEGVPVLKGRVPQRVLRILGVRLGVDTLASVQQRLGRTRLLDDSPNPHDPVSVCYFSSSSGATIFFESLDREEDPGEQGTAWSFTLAPSSTANTRCHPLAAGATVRSESGLRLEMTSAEVRKQLGAPSLATDALLLYAFQAHEWIGVIEVHLQGGKAARICAGEWKSL